MEPISFAAGVVGLAGLFSVCLDVVDKVDSYKDFAVESRSIIAQFEADKFLFTKWAKGVGIHKDVSENNYHSDLDNPEINLRVQWILSGIQEIFRKTDRTASNLRSMIEAGPNPFPDGILFHNTRIKPQKLKGDISKRSRIGWSFRTKARFIAQVQQFGALVQRLQSLVLIDGSIGLGSVNNISIRNDLGLRSDEATSFSYTQRLLSEMEKQIEHETRKELEYWLGASWTNDVYDNFIQRRLDGTCDWILSRQVFIDWTSSDFPSNTAKILWINGPAGHGKTILCARVIEHLPTLLDSPLAYYFCSSDSENRRNPRSIISSWISQVISCSQDAFELACGRWESKDGRSASQTDIVELFKTIVQHIPNCTFVVDGLDECAWTEEEWISHGNDSLKIFFESIEEAIAHTTTRLLIISRDEPDIRYGFRSTFGANQGLNEYKICAEDVQSDAMSFSRSVVDKKLTNKSEALKYELSQRIADRCEGMFLWVKMLEQHLRSGKNKKQLEETIDEAPTALNRLYDRDWMRISNLPYKDRLRAFSILRWATFALRPLTVYEITEALLILDDNNCEELSTDELPDAIDEDYVQSEILGLCGSLLETQIAAPKQDLGFMTIHLVHFSVKQYILCNMPAQEKLLINNQQLYASNETYQCNVLAVLCLRYLNLRNVWQEELQSESTLIKQPFRGYAAGSWYYHAREGSSNYEKVVELINTLFSAHDKTWELWKKWFDANDKSMVHWVPKEIMPRSPTYYASFLGLRDTVIYLLGENNLGLNHVDIFNRTALYAATLQGQTSTCQLLLERGADFTISDTEGWTPLNSAAFKGHIEVVKLLLDRGADVMISNTDGWTPLHLAAYNGDIEIVKLLLDRGADVTIASTDGFTPLSSASFNGHTEVIKLLLNRGASSTLSTYNKWRATPLHLAVCEGQTEVVKLLLDNGADVTVAGPDRLTLLGNASERGYVEVVKLLLEQGAEMNKDFAGRTPIFHAARNGHDMVVATLLTNECIDPDAKSYCSVTPLSAAIRNRHVEVVKLLLSTGRVDFNSQDCFRRSPLWWASKAANAEILQLLLDYGASKDILVKKGNIAMGAGSAAIDEVLRWCDVCTLDIQKNDGYYQCKICLGGNDIDICLECYKIGGCCPEASHELKLVKIL